MFKIIIFNNSNNSATTNIGRADKDSRRCCGSARSGGMLALLTSPLYWKVCGSQAGCDCDGQEHELGKEAAHHHVPRQI